MKTSIMRKVSLFFFVFCMASALIGCGDEGVPEGILSEQEMIPIILDVYLAEGKVNELRVKRDSALAIFEVYETKILEKYDLTDSVYSNSLRYYYDHPLKLESIYETVLDSLNLMEKRLDETKDADEKTEDKDSVNVEPKKVVEA